MAVAFPHTGSRTLARPLGARQKWSVGTGVVAGMGAYLVLMPCIQLVPDVGLYNGKRLLQVGLLAVVGIGLLGSKRLRTRWLRTIQQLPFIARLGVGAVFTLGIISSVRAPMPGYAVLEVAHFLLLFVCAGMVAAIYQQAPARMDRLLVGIVAVSVLMYAVQFAIGYGMSLASDQVALWPEGFTGFANIRHFNQYQTWTLPLLAVPVLWLPKRWGVFRYGVFGLMMLWWALMIASNVRGTVLAMAVAVGAVFVAYRHQARRWLRVQLSAFIGGGVLYGMLFYVVAGVEPQLVERLSDTGEYTGRLDYWRAALDMIGQHPWLGAGPMHFAWPANYFGAGAHPHSALLQWMAEWGVLATVLVLGVLGWGVWTWLRRSKRPNRSTVRRPMGVYVALTASLVAGGAHAMVSGLIVTPVSQMLMVAVIGWVWGMGAGERETSVLSRPRTTPPWAHALLCVCIVLALGWVSWKSWNDMRTMKERRVAFLEQVDRNLFSPRYWQQGFIGVREEVSP